MTGFPPSVVHAPVQQALSFTNDYNKWTTNSDDAELVDAIEIDGGIMEGVGMLMRWDVNKKSFLKMDHFQLETGSWDIKFLKWPSHLMKLCYVF